LAMFTTRTFEDDRLEFNIDNGLDQDLLRYCNEICQESCGADFDPDCGDCHVTRLYYAMVRLAEYEDIGFTPEEVVDFKSKLAEARYITNARIMKYDKLPARGKITSDGEKTRDCACGGRCYVFYDEDRIYRVDCEHCGTIVVFKSSSQDRAIKIWNDIIPTAIGT
jgi:hypothetical protein